MVNEISFPVAGEFGRVQVQDLRELGLVLVDEGQQRGQHGSVYAGGVAQGAAALLDELDDHELARLWSLARDKINGTSEITSARHGKVIAHCDGDHAPPECADSQCWRKEEPRDPRAATTLRAGFALAERVLDAADNPHRSAADFHCSAEDLQAMAETVYILGEDIRRMVETPNDPRLKTIACAWCLEHDGNTLEAFKTASRRNRMDARAHAFECAHSPLVKAIVALGGPQYANETALENALRNWFPIPIGRVPSGDESAIRAALQRLKDAPTSLRPILSDTDPMPTTPDDARRWFTPDPNAPKHEPSPRDEQILKDLIAEQDLIVSTKPTRHIPLHNIPGRKPERKMDPEALMLEEMEHERHEQSMPPAVEKGDRLTPTDVRLEDSDK